MVSDILAPAAMLHLLGGLVLATLVHQDASLRGHHRPLALAAGTLVLGVLGAVGYYAVRERIGELPADATRVRAPIGARTRDLFKGVLLIVGAFLCATAVVGLGANALVAAGVVVRDTLEFRVVAAVLQFLGFGVGVGGYLLVTRDWDLVEVRVPTLRTVGLIAVGVVALVLAQIAIARLLTVLGISVAQNQVVVTGQQDPRYFLYMIPVAILLVGPFEELVFRGGVQGILRRTWGPSVAIVVASVLFGLVHWIALTGGGGSRIPYVTVAATLGLVLGYLYERSRNLVVPAVVHGLYNTVLFGAQYLSATGMG
ncbi:CPBP family intramembrane metalloprotease [Haloplanus rubicundus]|uniref:CPBP family intramembrane metalloprotease n=1 Tax=Haloplanus rubicundus TaxID=1547898 RepID=A0A345E1A2_9EURY|nr:CPBP family intramembrane glutamic endopeptidase [Haloplanus rubicundus]AXG05974.1 CPBP family intramembrane metalloprotease [Haloplanus rubicundus]AXG09321.1 CPBP family intramembrane metalloprotease [Haloplanus rubicundus]